MSDVRPFTLNIPQEEVDRLQRKLRDTRHPTRDVVAGAGNDYGMPTQWALDLYNHWLNEYSWSKAQDQVNEWSHFTVTIEGIDVHSLHQRSSHKDAIPILMIHGWPGSFYEFSEVVPRLTEPKNASEQAFHCIVPSLPGFCFSSAPPRGWTVKDTARIFHAMVQRLGYERYMVQAGDWGQFVARELGAQYSDACQLLHLNYCPGKLPEGVEPSERELKAQEKGQDWRTNHVGYAVLMRTRPQTLGWMLEDNPLGLMAFVGEKYEEAASPEVQSKTSWRDHILTTTCLYYFSNCITTSSLVYYENTPHHLFADYATAEENQIRCPFGYTSMWYDTAPNSKRAVERTGNLVQYRERDYAGHFACLEDPEGMCEDIRELVKVHWKAA